MIEPSQWNTQIASLPEPQILQTWEWGQVKIDNGWTPQTMSWRNQAAALILKRSISVGGFAARMSVLYAPRGPLLDYSNASLLQEVLGDLANLARKQGAIFIKIDPFVPIATGIPGQENATDQPVGQKFESLLKQAGWVQSPEQVQFRNTVMIDLTPSEETLLANMKQKSRYNIRLAQKKGVSVRLGSKADLELLYRMYAETSVRDGFVIRHEGYYRRVWGTFMTEVPPDCFDQPTAQPLIAEVDGEPVAAIIVYRFGKMGWYMFGMSREAHRDKMPNYLLQWEAIRLLKACGCTRYDLWGAPDRFEESDSMWGVYRFKEGLGGTVVYTPGAWDLPVRPLLYKLYTQTLPGLLARMRRRGNAATRRAIHEKG